MDGRGLHGETFSDSRGGHRGCIYQVAGADTPRITARRSESGIAEMSARAARTCVRGREDTAKLAVWWLWQRGGTQKMVTRDRRGNATGGW